MNFGRWISAPLPITDAYCQKKMNELKRHIAQDIKDNGYDPDSYSNDYGFIYILAFENGLIKIGRSKNPIARARQLSVRSMVPCVLVHIHATNGTKFFEWAIKHELEKSIGFPDFGLEFWSVPVEMLGELPWGGPTIIRRW